MANRSEIATTSTRGAPNSVAASTKFKIEQKVPSGTIKKGPYAVERTVDPNDVVIKRRFAKKREGSKPLFEREDISVNRSQSNEVKQHAVSPIKAVQRRSRKHSSSNSSSPERFRHREVHHSTTAKHFTQPERVKDIHKAPIKRRTPDKVPYFLDEKREKDRLIRTYGTASSSSSVPKAQQKSSSSKIQESKRRYKRYSRSHSKSPTDLHSKSTHFPTHQRSASHNDRERQSSRSHQHHASREREYRPSSLHAERRKHYSSHYRRSRSLSRSRSRSRSHERNRAHSKDRRREDRDRHAPVVTPATQFITIPVPVEYPYGYPAWPHQPAAWSAAQTAPRFAAPYHLPSVMPTFADGPVMFPPMRPPPFGMPYNTRMFRPQRFASNFAPRANKANFRPRNY